MLSIHVCLKRENGRCVPVRFPVRTPNTPKRARASACTCPQTYARRVDVVLDVRDNPDGGGGFLGAQHSMHGLHYVCSLLSSGMQFPANMDDSCGSTGRRLHVTGLLTYKCTVSGMETRERRRAECINTEDCKHMFLVVAPPPEWGVDGIFYVKTL